jgi:hypothetical protein
MTDCPYWWVMPLVSSVAVGVATWAISTNRQIAAAKTASDRQNAKLKNTADMLMKWRTTDRIKESLNLLREIHLDEKRSIETLATDTKLKDDRVKVAFILGFLEDISSCAKHDIYDVELINSSIGTTVKKCWEMSKPFTVKLREKDSQPTLYENLEWLHMQIIAIRNK